MVLFEKIVLPVPVPLSGTQPYHYVPSFLCISLMYFRSRISIGCLEWLSLIVMERLRWTQESPSSLCPNYQSPMLFGWEGNQTIP